MQKIKGRMTDGVGEQEEREGSPLSLVEFELRLSERGQQPSEGLGKGLTGRKHQARRERAYRFKKQRESQWS